MSSAEHRAERRAAYESPSPAQQHHAVIAGTGRAGTSLLVRFLDRCGLETNIAGSTWSPQARAGHEHALDSTKPLPYVVKDPLLFSYCDRLDFTRIHIDALIVPVRDLMLAAHSRVHQERLAVLDNPWLRHRETQLAAATSGGVLYSLDVVDQARILAVGFHKLLHWATANELPLYLLEFPRMAEDPDYLLRRLWPWLGDHCSTVVARTAFNEVADMAVVRITPDALSRSGPIPLGQGEPDRAAVDRAVLLDRVEELAATLRLAQDEVSRLEEERRSNRLELNHLREETRSSESELSRLRAHVATLESQAQA
jgi:hypothetical protein